MGGLVIVGASLAGLRAAQGARAAGYEDEITVVGDERRMPEPSRADRPGMRRFPP